MSTPQDLPNDEKLALAVKELAAKLSNIETILAPLSPGEQVAALQEVQKLHPDYSLGITLKPEHKKGLGALKISTEKSRIYDGKLLLILDKLPEHIDKIHYFIQSGPECALDIDITWPSGDPIVKSLHNEITANEYRQNGMIFVPDLPPCSLLVTVIGEYHNGASPSYFGPKRIASFHAGGKEKIIYWLAWDNTTPEKFCTLHLKLTGQRGDYPTLYLLAKTDGGVPLSIKNIHQYNTLLTIEDQDFDYCGHSFSRNIPKSVFNNIKPGAQLRLLLAEEDERQYAVSCSDLTNCSLPQ